MYQEFEPIEYRGIGIDYNFYGQEEYSIQYCGDDYMFKTLEEAKDFIDREIIGLTFN